jgi:hypothetical protein
LPTIWLRKWGFLQSLFPWDSGFWPEDTPVELDEDKPNLVKIAHGMP